MSLQQDVLKESDRHYINTRDMMHRDEEEIDKFLEDRIKYYESILESVKCPISLRSALDSDINTFGKCQDGQIYSKSAFKDYVQRTPSCEVLRSPWTREELHNTELTTIGTDLRLLLIKIKSNLDHTRRMLTIQMNRIQLLEETKVIFNPSIHQEVTSSVTYKMKHVMLRKILDVISIADKVVVFGGLVRRQMVVSTKRHRRIKDNEVVDMDAILQPGWDIDINIDEESLEQVMEILQFHFDIKKTKSSQRYRHFQGGLSVTKLVARPKLNLTSIGINFQITMDIVTGERKMVDFSVNALECPTRDLSDISITDNLLTSSEYPILNSMDSMLYQRDLLNVIVDEIKNRTCRMIIYDDIDYIVSLHQQEQCNRVTPEKVQRIVRLYYRQLFYRLRKMLNDGWSVTNILTPVVIINNFICIKECGHTLDVNRIPERHGNVMSLRCTCGATHEFLDMQCIREFVH